MEQLLRRVPGIHQREAAIKVFLERQQARCRSRVPW